MASHGERLRTALSSGAVLPLMGVYDSYSAALAARHFDALFLSGFSFAAAFYGLPDEGFITWTDLAEAVQRVRAVAPAAHLLVDMDDGYGDAVVAAHATATFEERGASGIVLEDQLRPKKCGHLDGKQVMDLEGYLEKLEQVLAARRTLVVVARTDAADPTERLRRARAFDETDCDAILVDGLGADMSFLPVLRAAVRKPLVFNQIAGGKAAPQRWSDLERLGFSLIIHSTPCLFAAHQAIDAEMRMLRERDGAFIESGGGRVSLAEVNRHRQANLAARHGRAPRRTGP